LAQRDWFEKDYYKVLGVSESASKDEIKRAYRKLAHKYHPDANKGDKTAEQRFKEISEAHSVLSNDTKRKEYDEIRRFARTGGGPGVGFRPGGGRTRVTVGDIGDIGDLFGDLFDDGGRIGDLFGFRPRRRGQDLETEAHLTFEDAVSGTTFEIADGTKVRVPPGVTDGARIKVPRKGGPGPPDGGEPGDLFVRVHVEPHPFFSVGSNGDLIVDFPVTITEAALGAKLEVPTLDGGVTVKVPAGTRSGKTLRVKGKGGPRQRGGRADLLVKVRVEIPQKLSKKERELLEEFAALHDDSPRRHMESWMRKSGPRSRAAS
jgi:molecular chaperone DnaJ